MVPLMTRSGTIPTGDASRPVPPTNRGRKLPPEPLTRAEVLALLAAASGRSSSGIRLQALVGVMYGAGLRLAETLQLHVRDADLEAGTLRVRRGKGGSSRLVGLDAYAANLLARWLDRRSALGLTGRHPIFATYEAGRIGKPLSPRYVRTALARLGRKANIEKRVHPHGLRHSMAFDLAQSGVPTHQIQAQLGHASLAVTDRYIRHLAPVDVIAAMQAREWGPGTP
jgi:integrase/recombinase XerD